MKKRILQPLIRGFFLLLLGVLRHVSWRRAGAFGEALGRFAYRLSKRYRRVADKNLKIAYGDSLTEAERQAITKGVFQNFARATLAEFLKAPFLSPEELRVLVKADNYDIVDEVLARGKGMLLITGHFGNWELLARRAALEGYHFVVIARQGDDPKFNELTDRLRENGGYTVHPRGDSPRKILKMLREGGIVAILPDQKSDDLFAPFFGKLAGTVAGPAVLSLKTGAPIVPMFCPRQPDGTYRMEILSPIEPISTGDHDADVQRIMTEVNLVIEKMVRAYPDQWLWLHDRWRVQPPPELEAAYAAGKL